MKQRFILNTIALVAVLLFSITNAFADDHLLWDYTSGAPSSNPDNGLYYASVVKDGPGTKNGLYGIKMNSSGYCYFVKPAVAGTLRISFGPRDGSNASSLGVYEFTGDVSSPACAAEPFAITPEVTEYQTVSIDLTAEQTNIYIKRVTAVEQVLQKLEFVTGDAPEASPCTVTFKDQNGNIIGTKDAFEGDALGDIPYDEKDLPLISKSEVFRGWVYASGIKAKATDTLSGNTTITALVTPWEVVEVGSVQTYPLTSSIFYPEDHELIGIEGGYYHDAQHGWALASDGKISVRVAGNAQIILSLCKYSKDAAITVTDEAGNTVQTIASGMVENDGATVTVNYKGDATTLTFTWAKGESYIHSITVYNLEEFVGKDASTGYYIIPANDAAALLLALNSANSESGAKIFLPNGTYDLGEQTGTKISGKNISIIGQSAEGVVIKNAPDIKNEGLTKADLFYNTSTGLYMQDLTLQNALDYYSAGSAGRAACLQDCGNNTIAKNVRLLSYQDTYYSHKDGSYFYWEDGEIHGTVDYICGSGNVFFNGVTLVNESRSKSSKSGDCTISAASTKDRDKGYVFDGCTIKTHSSTFNFGRSWNNAKTAFINTTIESGKLIDTRWSASGINTDPAAYWEYNTVDKSGNGKNTPKSNVVTFKKANTAMETVISADKVAEFSYDSFFKGANWDPKTICAQQEVGDIDPESVYLIENGGMFVALAKGSALADMSLEGCTVRKANARGGFGEQSNVPTGIEDLVTTDSQNNTASSALYSIAGQRVNDSYRGIIIKDGKKIIK